MAIPAHLTSGDSYNNYDFPRRVHTHYTRQEQLRQMSDVPVSSHYAYPRALVSTAVASPPPVTTTTNTTAQLPQPQQQQQQQPTISDPQASVAVSMPYSASSTLRSDISTASSATTYIPQSNVSDSATNSPPGSPYVVRRQHPPSPLVLHSSSSNSASPSASMVYTPRESAEVQQQLNLNDALSSFESSVIGRELQNSYNGQQEVQY